MRTHTALCLAWSITLCAASRAADTAALSTGYQGIALRNVFWLKTPENVPVTPTPVAAPKIVLNVISTISNEKRAGLRVSWPAHAGEKPKEQSYLLGLGQREDDLEVLEIDEKAGIVKIACLGRIQAVTFEKENPKEPSSSAPAPPIPMPPPHPPAPPVTAQVSREQQEVLMELIRDQQRHDPNSPPLPPTSLTPLIEAANQ